LLKDVACHTIENVVCLRALQYIIAAPPIFHFEGALILAAAPWKFRTYAHL